MTKTHVMMKTCQKGYSLYVNRGSTSNGHSRKRTALITAAFTKPLFSELSYKLCIFYIPVRARKRPPATVTGTFSASQGCPLIRASIVLQSLVCSCGRQEEPAILMFRLLLRMRRLYVASICLDFH